MGFLAWERERMLGETCTHADCFLPFHLLLLLNGRINPQQVKAFCQRKHKYERHFLLTSSTVVFPDLGDNFLTLLHNFQIGRNNVLLRFAEINKKEKPGLVCSIYGFFTKLKNECGHHCTNVFQGPSQFWIRAKICKTREIINIHIFYKEINSWKISKSYAM